MVVVTDVVVTMAVVVAVPLFSSSQMLQPWL
jgi:hypothetical protein